MKRSASLRTRLILLFVASELLLVVVFAVGSFLFTQRRLTKAFDESLRAQTDAIATLVREPEGAPLRLALSEDAMSRFARKRRPDLFRVLRAEGTPIDNTYSMASPPEWVVPVEKKQFRSFVVKGERYRGLLLPANASLENQEPGSKAKGSRITVFFASTTHDLDDDIEDIQEFLFVAGGIVMLLSTLGAFGITKRVLKPLRDLTDVAGKIDAVSLDRRFVVKRLPSDLQPLGRSFNDLLARLQSSFDRERRFSADAAHELRTPVAVLKSGIQAALIAPPDSARDREALEELLVDVERIASLCESLLIVGRPGVGRRREAQMSARALGEELRRIVDSLLQVSGVPYSSISLTLKIEDETMLRTDADSTGRIVTNLVQNSLRYGGEGVQITLTLQDSLEDCVELVAEDDGPGIDEALEPRLFERFARGDQSRTRATGGAGLGLAISRTLAEADGGFLVYEPLPTTKGARFVWRIARAN